MKTAILFLFVFVLGSLSAIAQKDILEVQEVNYYGIDFSKVKIFRARETPEQFQDAFKAINELTRFEDKKYNFGKFFKKTTEWKSFDPVDQRNNQHAPEMLPRKMSSKELKAIHLSPAEVKEVIGSYGNEDNGIGVVIIAVLLNKDEPEGIYEVVFFDVKSKDILFQKEVTGKAGGAGLRNFWANSVYDAVKGFKYKLK